MNTPPGSRLERALADFAEQYGALIRAREQMRALSVTTCSKDGVVEVTVGSDGRAVGVRFIDRRFREMASAQLGDSVLEALTTARAEVTARVAAVMAAAAFPLPPSARSLPWDDRSAADAALDSPSWCWRRLVREARALTSGPGPVRESGVVKTGGAVGAWDAGAGVVETSRSRAQGPLWGRGRFGTRSGSAHASVPAELREAVLALRNSVCAAVSDPCGPPVCGCAGALERPGRGAGATAESA
ncbi:YbaB/EbfC family nucleoid-associated protein [Streptomyces sp. NPDC090106]|uniref:YbaB/EbfC family nucleoid-associated protein n=1 Tax=Streptomyces sp. NPDC090106 TaxID=3365946 RepID=UPI0037F923E6